MLGIPRLEPWAHALFEFGNNTIGDTAIKIGAGVCHDLLLGVWVAAAAATLARRRDRGSKRKGASRETVKSNGVFALLQSETASAFYGGSSLQRARAAPLADLPAAAGRKALRWQAENRA